MSLLFFLIVALSNNFTKAHDKSYNVYIEQTINNKQCMTNCIAHSDYYYCYYGHGWWDLDWDYCVPKKNKKAIYYTVDNKVCRSVCGRFDYDYNWCFTGPIDGSIDKIRSHWSYCVPINCVNTCDYSSNSFNDGDVWYNLEIPRNISNGTKKDEKITIDQCKNACLAAFKKTDTDGCFLHDLS